jgi:hypothetical protein
MTEQKPSVGRIVHYVSYGTPGGEYTSECRAAIITEVDKDDPYPYDECALAVLNPTGMFFTRARNDERPEGERMVGTWHWPERQTA